MSNRNLFLLQVIGLLVALLLLFIFLSLPLMLFRYLTGNDINTVVPGEIWVLVVSTGLGSGAAYYGFQQILRKYGGLDDKTIDDMWNGKK